MIPLRKKNKMLWVRGSLLTKYRIATFAPQRTFSFTPLGLAFCFFRFSNTHTPRSKGPGQLQLGTPSLEAGTNANEVRTTPKSK